MRIYPLTCSPAKNYYAASVKNQNHKSEMTNLNSAPSFKGWGSALSGGITGVTVGAAGVVLMWAPILGNKFCNVLKGKV